MQNFYNLVTDAYELSKKECNFPIAVHLAYATDENFLGRIVDGYNAESINICLLTKKAARSLCKAQNEVNKKGLGLLVFDAYRPLRAVKDFSRWFLEKPTKNEFKRKEIHYPHLEKRDLESLGYIAGGVSRHCFGHAIDLTLIDLASKTQLEMGTCFDFFDESSNATTAASQIGNQAFDNRRTLASTMKKFGFLSYEVEYWHFDFCERETDVPFDVQLLPSCNNN